VEGLFLNPNIYPEEEHEKRYRVYAHWADNAFLPVHPGGVSHGEWLEAIDAEPQKPGRCRLCYEFRMRKAALFAKEAGCDAFTTSLLVSPYQDHEAIVRAMEVASEEAGVPFLYQDLRPGYRRSREMARGAHLYMQKYCGCEFSQKEGS
jgi:predicted adenine nucleotide alpha hydrolase (AANH) superfamily ATPase